MSHMAKSMRLFSLLLSSPPEFLDRLSSIAQACQDRVKGSSHSYSVQEKANALRSLEIVLRGNLSLRDKEAPLIGIEAHVQQHSAQIPSDAPFGKHHNGDSLLGRVCYAVARELQPQVVVETGVCYGVTSSYLLKALDANGRGVLHSIDLPPLGKDGDRFVGSLIPGELRSRWNLHRGASRRVLYPLLARVGPLDLFIHDSLHTYRNMRDEFALAWPALCPGGVLISDDIEGNAAFLELSQKPDVARAVVIKEANKNSLLGVAVKCL
jgi:predicted O-methyltransferase YrrM